MSNFIKASVKDVREYWGCSNQDCRCFGKLIYINPDFYTNNGTPMCNSEDCQQELIFDHVEVRK